MKAQSIVLFVSSLGTFAAGLHAGPRTSASYDIVTEAVDAGGRRSSSITYTNDGSVGGIVGVATVSAPAETTKSGYVGQLYEATGLTLTAATLNVNETTTDQLAAWQALDDSTFLAVPPASVTWSIASGPLTGISASGLATAGTVYLPTNATAQGIYLGQTGSLVLTVLDSIPDNFGAYAGDGVGDDWQVQYFGQPPNANAGPAIDYSGTGQTNLFKYTAGLNPLDPNSRFTLTLAPVPGQAAQKNVIFAPLAAGRTYTIQVNAGLGAAGWTALTTGLPPIDSNGTRTVTDTSATGGARFYRVVITKP